jgi:hypothetical protein
VTAATVARERSPSTQVCAQGAFSAGPEGRSPARGRSRRPASRNVPRARRSSLVAEACGSEQPR